ncbi:hypothetical protein R83H12_02423 [Fibrobacteria bacterium R8-3-H12]
MRHFHFFGFILIIAAVAAFAAITMLLWNWLMPAIFGLPLLTYWQSAGILVLTRLLFGGIGHNGHFGRHGFNRNHKLREKWQNMSDEERKAFMEKGKTFMERARWGKEVPNE